MKGCKENFNALQADLLNKFAVGKSGTYVLKSSSVSDITSKFAVALSNRIAQVYDINGRIIQEHVHDGDITDIHFFRNDPFQLFTSTLNGKINIWDSRCQGGAVQTLMDNSDGGKLKPLLCFDYDIAESLLCAGTEVYREDAFLLFWDVRTFELLGGYWNSHTDDITQVHFCPEDPSYMASSAADGLINIFNLREEAEADALYYTLNSEASSINTFHWRHNNEIVCTTSMEEHQMWAVQEGNLLHKASKEELMANTMVQVDCMIDNIEIDRSIGPSYLVTGTYDGTVHLWDTMSKVVRPKGYELKGHSDLVRTISYNSRDEVLLTGGEDGNVCLWKLAEKAHN